MQSFGTALSDSTGLAVVIAILALVLIAAILLFVYRVVFGRSLHMAGGRARQPRLGVVDAFDLDRQRQLVLVRRDNVEHLIMIGGPNDILIESAVVRAGATALAPAARGAGPQPTLAIPQPDTEPTPMPVEAFRHGDGLRPTLAPIGAENGEPQPRPAAREVALPASPRDLGPLSDLPGPAPRTEPAPPEVPAPPAPAGTEPADASLRPAAPRLFPGSLDTAAFGNDPSSRSVTPAAKPAAPPRPMPTMAAPPPSRPASLLPNRPTPSAPMQRGTSAASLRREPVTPPPRPAEAPAAPALRPAPVLREESPVGPAAGPAPQPAPLAQPPAPTTPAPATPPSAAPAPALRPGSAPQGAIPITLDSFESLEEEMARLLGRAAGNKP